MIPICAFSHVFASARGAICIGLRKHFRGTMQAYFSVTALRLQLQLSEKTQNLTVLTADSYKMVYQTEQTEEKRI